MKKINFKDFQKLDIRIGTVTKAEVPEWSYWVMKFFKAKDLEGKQFPFIVNMEHKKIGPEGDFSEGMMLMAVERDDETTPPVFFKLHKKVPNGSRVM